MSDALRCSFPVLGGAAWSGTGKTTLLEQLLPLLREKGLSVAVIKHAHHQFDVDQPGKDSYKLRSAGATPMLIASRQRFALMQETPGQEEPNLAYLLTLMAPHHPDLVIVEGLSGMELYHFYEALEVASRSDVRALSVVKRSKAWGGAYPTYPAYYRRGKEMKNGK